MKLGFQQPNHTFREPKTEIYRIIERIALEAEHLGFDSFYVMDHLIQIPGVNPSTDPILEGWSTIAALAASTSKIRLGTMVTCNTFRNPTLLAKIGATVDNISRGRLIMGIGAGWSKEEHMAYGYRDQSLNERFGRLEESLQIMKLMWTQKRTNFTGKYYRVEDAVCNPRPTQEPHPPIVVGGDGERVTLRIAAKYADGCNVFGGADLGRLRRKLSALKGHCNELGRNYDRFWKTGLGHVIIGKDEWELREKIKRYIPTEPTTGATGVTTFEKRLQRFIIGDPETCIETIRKIFDEGLDYLVVNMPDSEDPDTLRLFGEKVLPSFS